MLRKLFIVPYFGTLPVWINSYVAICHALSEYGFDWLIYTNEQEFRTRVRDKLGVSFPLKYADKRKPCDLRPAYGVIFSDLLKGYDFWGHTDLDVVYGRIDKFVTNDILADCDLFSNDPGTICGPFSLFRNTPRINDLFTKFRKWRKVFENSKLHAFDEVGFSEVVNASRDLRVRYEFWQSHDSMDIHYPPALKLE